MPRLRRAALAGVFALASVFLVTACGDPEIGEECDDPGSSIECEHGAVCTTQHGQSICRARCVEQEDCPPAYACNGVTGTNLKSCQPA